MDGVTQRQRIRVTGTVQGVGFRPFVYRIAHELGITGSVGNDALGVFVDAQGSTDALDALKSVLVTDAPAMALVTEVFVEAELPVVQRTSFEIVASTDNEASAATSLPPDTAMCENCRREILDPGNRRYRHPFATCTDCGPRFTITTALPYDRPNTTMAMFPMCDACAAEYHDPADRRFHAQPIACPDCGPTLAYVRPGSTVQPVVGDDGLALAIGALCAGETVAIKGVGGFHLACTIDDAAAVQRLRERKHRGDKPFAVLVRDLEVARELAQVTAEEEVLLTSPQSPIVLLRIADNERARAVATVVAPGNGRIGIMLPPTPLHTLLLTAHPQVKQDALGAIVLTSCNLTDEPICIDNEQVVANFSDVADAFLLHDRAIHLPCDDSVVRITEAADGVLPQPVRRSRGYAPSPLRLPHAVVPTLAVGGELKTAICVAAADRAWMSQHIGDTGDYATMQVLDRVADIMMQVQRVRPERIVADRHPGYLSRRWAIETANRMGAEFVDVQHHHAHVASLLAEHRIPADEPVLGVAFDGTGYGDDGSIWGGEFLLGSYASVERVASLKPIALPGGDAAVRRPARIALAHLYAAGVLWDPALPPVAACAGTEASVLRRMLETGTSCVDTTSAGRLFDAVSALTGVTQDAGYEGQAAIELEALAADAGTSAAWSLTDSLGMANGGRLLVDPTEIIAATARDVLSGVPASLIGARFHMAMADAVVAVAKRVRASHGVTTVGLTGGVFQNALLTSLCARGLSKAGFRVLVHRLVPANDGGLALGQVVAGSP
jgi:hydrogenase maturation protein HypF